MTSKVSAHSNNEKLLMLPLTNVYCDKEGRLLRLWKNTCYGLFGSVEDENGKVTLIPGSKIYNPLNPKENKDDFVKRLEQSGLKQWDLTFDTRTQMLTVWPHLKAAGNNEEWSEKYKNLPKDKVKSDLERQGYIYHAEKDHWQHPTKKHIFRFDPHQNHFYFERGDVAYGSRRKYWRFEYAQEKRPEPVYEKPMDQPWADAKGSRKFWSMDRRKVEQYFGERGFKKNDATGKCWTREKDGAKVHFDPNGKKFYVELPENENRPYSTSNRTYDDNLRRQIGEGKKSSVDAARESIQHSKTLPKKERSQRKYWGYEYDVAVPTPRTTGGRGFGALGDTARGFSAAPLHGGDEIRKGSYRYLNEDGVKETLKRKGYVYVPYDNCYKHPRNGFLVHIDSKNKQLDVILPEHKHHDMSRRDRLHKDFKEYSASLQKQVAEGKMSNETAFRRESERADEHYAKIKYYRENRLIIKTIKFGEIPKTRVSSANFLRGNGAAMFAAGLHLKNILASDVPPNEKTKEVLKLIGDEAISWGLYAAGGRGASTTWEAAKMAYQLRNTDPKEAAKHGIRAGVSATIVGGTSSRVPGAAYLWILSRTFNQRRLQHEENMPTTFEGKIDYALNWLGALPDRGVDAISNAVAEGVVEHPENFILVGMGPMSAFVYENKRKVLEAAKRKEEQDQAQVARAAENEQFYAEAHQLFDSLVAFKADVNKFDQELKDQVKQDMISQMSSAPAAAPAEDPTDAPRASTGFLDFMKSFFTPSGSDSKGPIPSDQYAATLEALDGKHSIDIAALDKEIEDCDKMKEPGAKLEEALRQEKEANAATWQKGIRIAEAFIGTAFTTLNAVEDTNRLKGQLRDQERSQKNAQFKMEQDVGRAQHESIVPIHREHLDLHTSNYLDVWSIRELADSYHKDLKELKSCLEQNEADQKNIKAQLHSGHQLNNDISRYYRKAMASKSKLGKALKIVGAVFNGIGKVLSKVPEPYTQTAGLACEVIGAGTMQAGDLIASRANRKLAGMKEHLDEKNRRTSEGWQHQMHEALEEQRQLKAQQYADFEELRQHGSFLPPASQMSNLSKAMDVLTGDQAQVNAAISQNNGSIDNLSKSLQADKDKLAAMQQKHRKGHNRQKDKLKTEIAAKEEALAQERQTAKILQKQKETCDKEIEKTTQAVHDAELLASQSQRRHDLLAKFEPSFTPSDGIESPERRQQREDARKVVSGLEANIQLHHQLTENERAYVDLISKAAMNIAMILGGITGSDRPAQAIALGTQVYGIIDLGRHVHHAMEEYEKFQKEHGKLIQDAKNNNNLQRATQEALRLIYMANVVSPVAQGLFLLYSTVKLGRHILYGRKYGWGNHTFQNIFTSDDPQKRSTNVVEFFNNIGCQIMPQWSPELEAQLCALDHAMGSLKEHLDGHYQHIVSLVDVSLRGEMNKVHISLTKVCDRLLSANQTSETILHNFAKETVDDTYLTEMMTRKTEWVSGLKEQKRPLKTPDENDKDQKKRIEKLNAYLEKWVTTLEWLTQYENNGLVPKPHQADKSYKSRVDVTLIHENPDYFAALLGLEGGYKAEMPNWMLYVALLEHFLGDFKEFLESKELGHQQCVITMKSKSAHVDPVLRKLFTLIHTYKRSLDGLVTEALPHLIRRLMACQNEMRRQHQSHFMHVHEFKQAVLKKQQRAALKNSLALLDHIRTKAVGAKKFYLHKELVHDELSLKVPAWNLLDLYKYHTRFSAALKLGLAGVGMVGLGALSFMSGKMGPAVTLGALGTWSVGRSVFNTVKSNFLFHDTRSKITQAVSDRFNEELKRSVSDLFHAKGKAIIKFKDVKYRDEHGVLALDLSQRQLVWINGPLAEHQLPVLTADLDVEEPRLGLVLDKGTVRGEDLGKLPTPPAAVYQTEDSYDNDVYTLSALYGLFLLSHQTNAELAATNPFHSIMDTCEVVSGRGGRLIEFAFPKVLIDELKGRLYPALHHLEGSGEGTLVPFYDVEIKEGKLQLSIYFRHLHPRKNEVKNYCHFLIAEFDYTTVRAFFSDLNTSRHAVDLVDGLLIEDRAGLNEFLLQAMYGSFGAKLGLPGADTHQLSSGLLAPDEKPFPGLYRLWEMKPTQMISFVSSLYTDEMSASLMEGVKQGGKIEGEAVKMFYPIPPLKADDGYLDVWHEVNTTQTELEKNEKTFIHEYARLYGLVKLVSDATDDELTTQLVQMLGVYPPQMRSALYETWLLPAPEVPKENIDAVVDYLYQRPSSYVWQLNDVYGQVNELEVKLGLREKEATQDASSAVKMTGAPQKIAEGMTFTPSTIPVAYCNNVVGLPNIGQSCYINAAIQSLLAIPSFQERVKAIAKLPKKSDMQRDLAEVQYSIQSKKLTRIRAKLMDFRKSLFAPTKDSLSDFKEGIDKQKDAHALMLTLLQSCQYQVQVQESRVTIDSARAEKKLDPQIQPTVVFSLPIEGSPTVEAKWEDLVDRYFNDMEEDMRTTRRITGEAPDMLVMQLLRFQANEKYDPKQRQSVENAPYKKLATPVTFPKDGMLDMTPYMNKSVQYQLKAVVDHQGEGYVGGHYTATVLDGSHWIKADDSEITVSTKEAVATGQHYLYVFEKVK